MNQVLRERRLPNEVSLKLVRGDLTREQVDAIVNAANEWLMHGGGVAGAIVAKGGESIQRESDEWVRRHGPITHERPAWTSGGRLPARYVIHAVGPRWGEGREEERLRITIRSALDRARALGVNSIAFPLISAGIFGYPSLEAARVILETLLTWAQEHPQPADVRLVIYEQSLAETIRDRWDVWLKL
ncbi:MAG: macro domain-containing protein [Anaerolineales bacterium]